MSEPRRGKGRALASAGDGDEAPDEVPVDPSVEPGGLLLGSPVLVLAKVARILEVFEQDGPELSGAQVCRATGLPSSTIGRLLANLAHLGFLERCDDNSYQPGPRLLFWGSPSARDRQLTQIAQPLLDRLRDETGETALLFVRDGDLRVPVALAPTRHVVAYSVAVGQMMPLHAGSAGRVLLAYDEETLARVLTGCLPRYSATTVTDPEELRRSLAEVRRAGIAKSDEERMTGVAGVSAPVFGPDRTIRAAVGVAGPRQRFTAANVAQWTPLVIQAGQSISRLLALGTPHHDRRASPAPHPQGVYSSKETNP